MPNLPDILGIDTGLTFLQRTSGICRTGTSGDVVDHTYVDRASRLAALAPVANYHLLAIDAPVLPSGLLNYDVRPCEKLFVWGAFQKRCKPGESHVSGTGQALRRAGLDTAKSFEENISNDSRSAPFPKVIESSNVIEAFPNAFLGVCVRDTKYETVPARGKKTDWLYDLWVAEKLFEKLRATISWERPDFWQQVTTNRHHDERAALICALTAICTYRGKYVAVGEPNGGYFFLPPWTLWDSWAKATLRVNRLDRRLGAQVEVWIAGKRYLQTEPLPE
jgi:predicted nuclease with RNAse H fold